MTDSLFLAKAHLLSRNENGTNLHGSGSVESPARCCTPEQAWEWYALLKDDPDLSGLAWLHWREVEEWPH